jgi:hypothetical protein
VDDEQVSFFLFRMHMLITCAGLEAGLADYAPGKVFVFVVYTS